MGWYPSTKHAVETLGDALRRETMHCLPGIEVVIVEPALIPTELTLNGPPRLFHPHP